MAVIRNPNARIFQDRISGAASKLLEEFNPLRVINAGGIGKPILDEWLGDESTIDSPVELRMNHTTTTILVVNDNDKERGRLVRILRSQDWGVVEATTNTQAFEYVSRQQVKLVITDIERKEERYGEKGNLGLDLLNALQDRFPIIVYTAFDENYAKTLLVNFPAVSILSRESDDRSIIELVRTRLDKLSESETGTKELPPDFFVRVVQILVPYFPTKVERESFLIQAFYLAEPRIPYLIQTDGSPDTFATLCVKALLDFGCLDGKHSLSHLLQTIRDYMGIEKHHEIDELVKLLEPLCSDSFQASEDATTPLSSLSGDVVTVDTPTEERSPTIFINYSHNDAAFVQRLIEDLNRAGHSIWIDTTNIKGGDEWMRSIADGINNSYAFIVLCTHDSLKSNWVRAEILWARQKKKLIIPLLLEDVTKDDSFFGLHSYENIVFDDYDVALTKLIQLLPLPQISQNVTNEIPANTVNRRALELDYLDRLLFENIVSTENLVTARGRYGKQIQSERSQSTILTTDTKDDSNVSSTSQPIGDVTQELLLIRRAILLGEPGSGKTTVLRAIARNLADKSKSDLQAPFPIFVRLARWVQPDQSLIGFISTEMGPLGSYLSEILADGRLALMLDGMDEIPSAQQPKKYSEIQSFITQYPQSTVIVSSRILSYQNNLDLPHVYLEAGN